VGPPARRRRHLPLSGVPTPRSRHHCPALRSILDGQVHSVVPNDGMVLTLGAYYDYLATMPAIIPEGPISILGLAGGTVARALHKFFPHQ